MLYKPIPTSLIMAIASKSSYVNDSSKSSSSSLNWFKGNCGSLELASVNFKKSFLNLEYAAAGASSSSIVWSLRLHKKKEGADYV